MPYVEVAQDIAADKNIIYPLIKDMEKYPEFMCDLKSVTVIERKDNYTITKWESLVDGKEIQWTEKDIFDDQNMHISYYQIEGDLKKFEGEWILESTDSGTKVKLTVDFEFGIPMIAGLLNPILKRKIKENCENMLKAVKNKIES